MATSSRRQVNKVQNVRLPLIGSMSNRDSTGQKDQRFVNIFPETRKVDQIESTKIFLNKRPGLTAYKDFGTGEGRGIAYFNNKMYVAIGNKLYEDAVTPTEKITFSGTTGPVGMITANSSTEGDYLFVCDGIGAWTINTSGTVVAITSDSVIRVTVTAGGTGYTSAPAVSFTGGGGTDATATANISSGVVTSVVITAGGSGFTSAPTVVFTGGDGSGATATSVINSFPTPHVPTPVLLDGYIFLPKGIDIYNCDLDRPGIWYSFDYISAEMYPDQIKSLAKQNNQIVAFGTNSVEFFYDAANPSASPLSRNDSTALQIGIAAPYAVYQQEKLVVFVSQSDSGGRAVWQLDGFTPKRLSDEYVDRIISSESSITDARGFGVRVMGHMFYVLNLPNANRTLVYDLDEKLWHEWSTNVADAHTVFKYDYMADLGGGSGYLLHESDGTVVKLDSTSYTDSGTAILLDLITNRFDMDTINRKFQSNIRLVGDRYESGNSVDIRWTDDDYQTWSNWKPLALTDDFPNFARMGSFRRRAYQWRHTGNYPFRCESMEVTFVEGAH